MANPLKGEIEVSLGGKKLLLRPSFEGLVEIEDRTGMGLSEILALFGKSKWTLKTVTAVIYGGLKHLDDSALSYEKVGAQIVQAGMGKFLVPAVKLISRSLAPEEEIASEKKDEAGPSP